MLVHHTARFVDRDMFMRYRGGGIGHRYMREIEEIYENMFRERMHHKEYRRASSSTDPADTVNDSGSDDECEPEAPVNTQTSDTGTSDAPANGAVGDNGDDSDSDYEPPRTDSGGSDSSGESDTDNFDSEGEILDGYGLGDL